MTDFDDHDAALDEDDEPIEAYCVRCKEMVEMEDAQPVWTRKGTPGTRGFCSICGTTVFRMGRTPAHDKLKRPNTERLAKAMSPPKARRGSTHQAMSATYINYAPGGEALAKKLAEDLPNVGVAAWLPTAENGEVAWAGGVHPALTECATMVVVLSPDALADEKVQEAWAFFREQRKPLVVAQVAAVAVPDDLRRAARVDFSGDYRPALRELVQALAE
jgi:hypothetical protein